MDSRPPTNVRNSPQAGFTLVEILMVITPVLFLSLGVITAYLFLGRNFTRLASTQQQDIKARRALFYFTQDVSSAISFTSVTSSNLTMTVPTTLTLTNCATTSGNTTVTCANTSSLGAGMTLSSTSAGIPSAATVSSVTNGTKFVMSASATATGTGLTISAVGTPTNVTYAYNVTADTSTPPLFPAYSLTRKSGSDPLTVLLTDIDSTATTPTNGFACYNESGVAVTLASSVKEVEFGFTTKVGNSTVGTQSSYKIVSPRVVVRNKPLLQ